MSALETEMDKRVVSGGCGCVREGRACVREGVFALQTRSPQTRGSKEGMLPRHAQVGNSDVRKVGRHKNIARRDVAVDEPSAMHELELCNKGVFALATGRGQAV